MTATPKTILLTTALGAALAAGGVAAEARPGAHGKGATKAGKAKGHAKKCAKARKVGFVVRGTFVSGTGRTVTLTVTKANRHARKSGLVTAGENFTITARKVRYVHRSGPSDAEVGDKVRVVGKVTKLKKGCSASGFTPAATARKVTVVGSPEAPETADPSEASEDAGDAGEFEAPGDEGAPESGEDAEEFAAL